MGQESAAGAARMRSEGRGGLVVQEMGGEKAALLTPVGVSLLLCFSLLGFGFLLRYGFFCIWDCFASGFSF